MRESSSFTVLLTPTTLRTFLDQHPDPHDTGDALKSLVDAGYGDLPHPGLGNTLKRWQMLATVAQVDLALAKLYESHADALAILHELGHTNCGGGSIWAVWCAEPPNYRVHAVVDTSIPETVHLHGTKTWCSGARHVSHALVSAWDSEEAPCLTAIAIDQAKLRVSSDPWPAVGMAATDSAEVVLDGAEGALVGAPRAYLDRPGFHHGAAGVAACWYGAASAIAQRVLCTVRDRPEDAHALAHLGAIDLALVQARQQLHMAATEIDATPHDACQNAVRRARLAVESAAELVLIRAPRAFGPGPMCQDARIARLMADLPVFIRQSHAERDLQNHGAALAEHLTEAPWAL